MGDTAPFAPDLQATKEKRYNPKSTRIIFTLQLTSLEALTIMKVGQENVLKCQNVDPHSSLWLGWSEGWSEPPWSED